MLVRIDEQFVDETEKCLPLSAPGIQYGYGVFETIRLAEGKLRYFDAHYERLLSGCQATLLQMPYSEKILEEFCLQLSKKNEMEHGVIKVTCFKNAQRDSVLISCRKNPYKREAFLKGFKVKISRYRRNPYSKLVGLKTNNYLENYLERQAALQEGFDEALFFNTNGVVSECSASNIFFIKDHHIYTPCIRTGILPGIMRGVILKKAESSGITVEEGYFDREFLTKVDGAFLTNSIMEAMPVARIKGDQYADDRDMDMRLNVDIVHTLLKKLVTTQPTNHTNYTN